ncbi:hypothetical protein [Ktedonospora formicarum]|uniref:Uncharacterized protein n=1 Tax=Ktedonospora formicarum TaxID=2778364 RepID=A0A8J3HWN8_9CHLR|nr:hypothetical protein [Ktedonospora formicarum]GHO42052.1 hypothetical protein KSX_02150 [Ktedonospora formicarum]
MTNSSSFPAKTAHTRNIVSWRDRTAMVLMLLAFAGALFSFLSGLGESVAASPITQVVEIWRTYGFGLFSGLFLLLAFFPRRYPGIWELAILNKAALAFTGLILLGHGTKDASTILFFDGALTLIIALAYILTRGYSGWATFKTAQTK